MPANRWRMATRDGAPQRDQDQTTKSAPRCGSTPITPIPLRHPRNTRQLE